MACARWGFSFLDMPLSEIAVSGLSFAYRDKTTLTDINLTVKNDAKLAILGANGSGKTTLAQFLAGWLPDGHTYGGSVTCDGRPWHEWPLAERATMVQLIGQIPVRHLSARAFTVREEVAFGPENLNLPLPEIRQRTERVLAQCRIEHLADRDPFTLSGGEQQRLVIAASLALHPKFLILDEPLTNLDPEAREHVLTLLDSLSSQCAVVLLETNPDIALAFADEYVLLGDARICARGSARDVLLNVLSLEKLGLPAVPRACRELGLFANLTDQELPLYLNELQQMAGAQSHA